MLYNMPAYCFILIRLFKVSIVSKICIHIQCNSDTWNLDISNFFHSP